MNYDAITVIRRETFIFKDKVRMAIFNIQNENSRNLEVDKLNQTLNFC